MPQQTYLISFVGAPQDRVNDQLGALVPFSFTPLDYANAYRATFNPKSTWDALVEQTVLYADRQTSYLGSTLTESVLAGSYHYGMSEDLFRLAQHSLDGIQAQVIEWAQDHHSGMRSDLSLLSDKNKEYGLIRTGLTAARNKYYGIIPRDMAIAKDVHAGAVFTQMQKIAKDAQTQALVTEGSVLAKDSHTSAIVINGQKASDLEKHFAVVGEHLIMSKNKIASIDVWQALELATNASSPQRMGYIETSFQPAVRMQKARTALGSESLQTASRTSRLARIDELVTMTGLSKKTAFIDQIPLLYTIRGHRALYDDLVVDANLEAQRAEMAELLAGVTRKPSPAAYLEEIEGAERKATDATYLEQDLFQKASHPSLFQRERDIQGKRTVPRAHLESLLLALTDVKHQGHIGHDEIGVSNHLVRPALLSGEAGQATLQGEYSQFDFVGHDDRDDLMDIPNNDYPYEDRVSRLYDENGVPIDAIGDPNLPDVQVKYPLTHPFPTWATVSDTEIWVNLWPLKDTIMTLVQLWRLNVAKLAGMNMLDALNFVLEQLYDVIDNKFRTVPDYFRVFRLTRWYAERIVLNQSQIILHRTYSGWRDQLYQTGSFGLPSNRVELVNFDIDAATGTLQSTAPTGNFTLWISNYITSDFVFSTSIQPGSPASTLAFLIDGVQVKQLTYDGFPHRMTFSVPPGDHTFTWQWGGNMGDKVIFSGFQFDGTTFEGATTTIEDQGSTQGSKAVQLLVNDLMRYYQDHWDQFKTKGHLAVDQRKTWIEL